MADIDEKHGRDVLIMHYNKLSRIFQICSEASNHVGICVKQLAAAALDSLNFCIAQ